MEEQNQQKLTKAESNKRYREENKEHIRQYRNEYYHKNKEKISKQHKASYERNKEKRKASQKIQREKNKEKRSKQQKEYREKNKETVRAGNKRYYENNKERILKEEKEYRDANKELLAEQRKQKRLAKGPPAQRPYITPKEYTEEEIQELLTQYKSQPEKYWCPLTNKVYKTHGIWTGIFGSRMTKPCVNRFMFLLQEPHYSAYSGKQLTEDEFSYSETYKGWTGFKKYTLEEIEQRVWMKTRDYSFTKTPEHRKKLSERGINFYQTEKGIQLKEEKSKKMTEFFQTEEGKKQKTETSKKNSASMKKLIAEGKFTPAITNTWTHWNAQIEFEDGTVKKFRSSWEACFYYSNQHLAYESIRVKEVDRTYVSDFVDEQANIMYEIKPRNRYNIEIDKMTSLQNYCTNNGLKFIWLNEGNILDYIDVEKLAKDEKNKEQFLKMLKDPTMKKIYESKCAKN
jgi:hypothetical protein